MLVLGWTPSQTVSKSLRQAAKTNRQLSIVAVSIFIAYAFLVSPGATQLLNQIFSHRWYPSTGFLHHIVVPKVLGIGDVLLDIAVSCSAIYAMLLYRRQWTGKVNPKVNSAASRWIIFSWGLLLGYKALIYNQPAETSVIHRWGWVFDYYHVLVFGFYAVPLVSYGLSWLDLCWHHPIVRKDKTIWAVVSITVIALVAYLYLYLQDPDPIRYTKGPTFNTGTWGQNYTNRAFTPNGS